MTKELTQSDALLELNRYANNVLNDFNEKHKTQFSCNMGIGESLCATSRLDKRSQVVFITLPGQRLYHITDSVGLRAFKILVGHELSHHIYANMSMTSFEVIGMCITNATHIYTKLITSNCIEVAADIHGKKFLKDSGESVTSEVLAKYSRLIAMPNEEDRNVIATILKNGYLPSATRIWFISNYDSFKHDSYKPVSEILEELHDAFEVVFCKDMPFMAYKPAVLKRFQEINFPNRPNRIR